MEDDLENVRVVEVANDNREHTVGQEGTDIDPCHTHDVGKHGRLSAHQLRENGGVFLAEGTGGTSALESYHRELAEAGNRSSRIVRVQVNHDGIVDRGADDLFEFRRVQHHTVVGGDELLEVLDEIHPESRLVDDELRPGLVVVHVGHIVDADSLMADAELESPIEL